MKEALSLKSEGLPASWLQIEGCLIELSDLVIFRLIFIKTIYCKMITSSIKSYNLVMALIV